MQIIFDITGMSCSACSSRIEKMVNKLECVKKAEVNLLTNSMVVDIDDKKNINIIIKTVEKLGYGASLQKNVKKEEKQENKAKLITFELNNEQFKVDLVQKRKKKKGE